MSRRAPWDMPEGEVNRAFAVLETDAKGRVCNSASDFNSEFAEVPSIFEQQTVSAFF